ncbi:type II secretion system F family protein [Croceicoccus sp. Ery5]|jgi:tight adherence protein C|uniref:type II secretion system F family protein n=1 Tax=Croceicoccus sp. Ery5 TaxID=1703340 RepID=UPI001E30CC72|nr:type II secretion system F family protein [Croceicoccus sp. Ery5]
MIDFILANQTARIATLVGLFAIVAALVYLALGAFSRRSQIRAGLQTLGTDRREAQTAASLRESNNNSAWSNLADMVERTGLSLADTQSERLRDKLIEAGYTHPSAPRIFTLTRLVLPFVLVIGFVLIVYSRPEPPGFFTVYFFGAILGFLGLYLPNIYVQAKADRRREQIVNGFPDCLDLLLVCVEAGLGIEAGMDRVGREMVQSHPLVSQLLSVAVLRLRAGASREEAFRKMADMAGVDEIRSFTTLLVQSDKLGTSISSTLRVYASEMREKRRMRAEEKAHRIPVLISVPLVVCMLPTMIGVLMLPASIRVVRDIFPLMNG